MDNGAPWGSTGDFPTELSLWLIGLGVEMHWDSPGSPQENGVVERSQGTSGRWCEPRTCATAEELQARLDRMDRLLPEDQRTFAADRWRIDSGSRAFDIATSYVISPRW